MAAWAEDELRSVEAAQEVDIAPVRRNSALRRPTPIWIVRTGDDLYVRAAYEANKGWHGVARSSGQARISTAGFERDVSIEDAEAG